jgi:predicted oxidoreductase
MREQLLGKSTLKSTKIAYGCQRVMPLMQSSVTKEDEKKGKRAIITAYEVGIRYFENADFYALGRSEKLMGDVLREVRGMRNNIVLASKCGCRFAGTSLRCPPVYYDLSMGHIIQSCEGSLKRLGVETIDLYQFNRPDLLMDPEEAAAALEKLHSQGKIREVGVSNFSPSQVKVLQSALSMEIVSNQVQISAAYIKCFEDGILDQCLAEKITPLSWSPLARGILGDRKIPENYPNKATTALLLKILDMIAKAKDTTRAVIALAWLMKHPAGIIPIIGTTSPKHIREAAEADDMELSREEWYLIYTASRGEPLP